MRTFTFTRTLTRTFTFRKRTKSLPIIADLFKPLELEIHSEPFLNVEEFFVTFAFQQQRELLVDILEKSKKDAADDEQTLFKDWDEQTLFKEM